MPSNIIIGPAYPLRGGIANLNEALCDNFNKAGIKSEIVSFSLQYPGFLFPGKTQMETSVISHSFSIHTLINSINPFTWWKAARFIKSKKPDYVIIRYWLPFMAPCLGTIARWVKSKNIKVISIADNVIPHEKRTGDASFTKYFINSCDAFVVMSEKVKEDILLFNKTKPVVCTPHPVYNIFGDAVSKQEACRRLNLDASYNYILFFGFIRKYKGLDILLEALPLLQSRNIKLIVGGEFYEPKKEYLDIIEKYKLQDNVIIADTYIPKEIVKYYFSAADVVVQPYRNATQSGVTQIAYSFNKPMIVTNVGGLPEMVTNGVSGYVTEANAKAIAQSIDEFYIANKKCEFEKGVEMEKRRFGWETFIEKINHLYSTLS